MTFETSIMIGPDDILSVVFRCKKCKAALTIPITTVEHGPLSCQHCQEQWLKEGTSEELLVKGFIQAIKKAPDALKNRNFDLMLEIRNPKRDAGSL